MKTPISLSSKRHLCRSSDRKDMMPKPVGHTSIGDKISSFAHSLKVKWADSRIFLECCAKSLKKLNALGGFQLTSPFTSYIFITNTISQ